MRTGITLCLVVFLCAVLAAQALGLEWHHVSSPTSGPAKMAVAPDGSLYMASGNKLSHWNGSGWDSEIITSTPGYGADYDLRFSSDGTPHVLYNYGTGGAVIYCTKSGGVWTSEYVTQSACNIAMSASLGLDSSGKVYVPVVFGTAGQTEKLYLMTRGTDGVWSQSAVDLGYRAAWWPNIQVASSTSMRIVYTTGSSDDLKIATLRNGAWTYQVPDSAGTTGWFPSFSVSAIGRARISYSCMTDGRTYALVENKYGNLERYSVDTSTYSLYGVANSLRDGTPIMTYATSNTNNGNPSGIRFAILRNGVMVHDQVGDSTAIPTMYDSDFTSAVVGDQLFVGYPGNVWYATVPEPGSSAGLIAGLVAMMPLMRRRR